MSTFRRQLRLWIIAGVIFGLLVTGAYAAIMAGVPFTGEWSDPPGYPPEVLDKMDSLARDYYAQNGWDDYLLSALADVWFEQIEEGTPP